MFKQMVLTLAAVCLLGAEAQAHALLAHDVPAGDARVVSFTYSSGEPAAYAEARLYGPGDADVEFQNGRTDAEGRFAFLPAQPGTWKIVVADNMGHKVSHAMTIAPAGATSGSVPVPADSGEGAWGSVPFRAVFGISLLLNLFLGLAWFRRRVSK